MHSIIRPKCTIHLSLAVLLGISLYAAGCGGGGGGNDAATSTEASPTEPAPNDTEPTEPVNPTPDDPVPADPAPPSFSLVPDARYGETGAVRHITIPTTDCANLTATPIVVGDWLVYPNHEHGNNCSGNSKYQRVLFGYHLTDGRLYLLYEGGAGEASLTHDTENDTLWWTTTFGATVHLLDPETFELRRKTNVGTTADSGGALLDGAFYFGNTNTPHDVCQEPINPQCGALISLDSTGEVIHQLDTDDGFRAWIGTSVTTDGDALYFGSAGQTVGEKSGDETEYLYGCSVIKTDESLNILASFDPGDLACFQQPYNGADLDSVGGEVVPDTTGVWVQYVRPNSEGLQSSLYRLNLDLEEQCSLQFDYEPQTQSVAFYAGPTVDEEGYAYIVVNVPDDENTRRGLLLRVAPDCSTTTLAEAPGRWAYASATLADDAYVLFATDGRLQVLTRSGTVVQEYALGSPARVTASPVLHDGVVYIVQEDATINVIEGTGLSGYGTAPWPRYRHDNSGTGALD